jgi:hypothetical protein
VVADGWIPGVVDSSEFEAALELADRLESLEAVAAVIRYAPEWHGTLAELVATAITATDPLPD